jgi:hypothetical protein
VLPQRDPREDVWILLQSHLLCIVGSLRKAKELPGDRLYVSVVDLRWEDFSERTCISILVLCNESDAIIHQLQDKVS